MSAPKRTTLHLARPEDARADPAWPAYSLVKQAILLYRGRGVSKEVCHRNARAWLISRQRMGERHILNAKFEPRWGQPGTGKEIGQVFSPRRMTQ